MTAAAPRMATSQGWPTDKEGHSERKATAKGWPQRKYGHSERMATKHRTRTGAKMAIKQG